MDNRKVSMVKVKRLREIIDVERGLKRKWVAEQIGLTEGSFKQIIAGNSQMGPEKAKVLAKLLGVKLSDIWDEK